MPSPSALRRLGSIFGVVAIGLLSLTFIAGDYRDRIQSIQSHSALGSTDAAGASVRPPGDTRDIVFPLDSMDTHWWVLHAEQFAASHRPVRHTERDNSPGGREVHWSASMSAGLAAIGWLLPHVSDIPARDAIPFAALWLGPSLFALVLTGLFLATRHNLGTAPATVLLLCLGTSPGFLACFAPGEADHHGIAITAALLSVWPIILGGGRRRAFAAAGVAGGVALWISAATAIPVLIAIAGGALLDSGLRRSCASVSAAARPELWSVWGRWGAGTALFFYGIEYLPLHAGLRLEVNHPMHALAWWGGSAWLSRLVASINFTDTPRPRSFLTVPALLQAVAAVTPLLLVFFGGDRFFHLRDPLLWALHRDYIREFQSLPAALAGESGLLALPLLWLVVIPSGVALHRLLRLRPESIQPLAVLLAPSCLALALTWAQVRWQGLATLLCAALAAALWAHRPRSRSFRIAYGLLVACAVLQFPALRFFQPDRPRSDRSELASLVVRDVAWALHSATEPNRAVVLSGPTTSTQLAYFGGLRVLGTLYWENLAGLRAAAAIFGTPDLDEALRLCRHHGVTHLVLFSWDDFGAAYARLHHAAAEGIDFSAPAPGSLAGLLAERRLPAWLRPLAYDIPPALGLADQRVQIYEIHPDQTPAEAFLHLARYQLEIGDSRAARASLVDNLALLRAQPAVAREAAALAAEAGWPDLAHRFAP